VNNSTPQKENISNYFFAIPKKIESNKITKLRAML